MSNIELMSEESCKYLVCSERDMSWGMTVNTVGKQRIPVDYESYPPRSVHPDDFWFNPEKGRILNSYQLLYITEGSGLFYTSHEKSLRLQSGDMFMLRPYMWHSYFPDKRTGWMQYWIGFKGVDIDNRIRNDFFNLDQIIYKVGLRDDVVNLYEKALDVAKKEKASYQQYLAGIANLLLGIMMYSDKNTIFQEKEAYARINRAKLIMRDRLTSEIDLEEIAGEVSMSYSWFRKLFKEYTGMSPASYIQEMKMERAKTMLMASELSVKEIAYLLNFESVSYFSATFKTRTGKTPSEYRQSFMR